MTGLTSLDQILEQLSPRLCSKNYVYCSVDFTRQRGLEALEPFAIIRESEAMTLVLPESQARELGVSENRLFRRISLGVHSSLEAVGLTAIVSRALADAGISANIIAGYYHDHFMVPAAQAEKALEILVGLAGKHDDA